jgi:hypothetical protein
MTHEGGHTTNHLVAGMVSRILHLLRHRTNGVVLHGQSKRVTLLNKGARRFSNLEQAGICKDVVESCDTAYPYWPPSTQQLSRVRAVHAKDCNALAGMARMLSYATAACQNLLEAISARDVSSRSMG